MKQYAYIKQSRNTILASALSAPALVSFLIFLACLKSFISEVLIVYAMGDVFEVL